MKLTKEQKQEIADQQAQKNTTKRVTSPELEKILYEALPVLDHGFVRVVDYMGDDSSIVQSARVSYGKGTKKVSTDEGLIKYLMRHWHSTPFEMCEIKYHVKLPIFIARQWIRHRTANVNEYSARYSILDKEFYIPAKDQLADSHAQYEIRVYAETMLDTVKKWVPITHAAFLDYRVGAVHVSAKGKKVIQLIAKGEKVSHESSGLSKREWNELMTAFDLKDKLI